MEREIHLVEAGGNELVIRLQGKDGVVDDRRLDVGVYEPGDVNGAGITLTLKQARELRAYLNMVAP